MSFSGDVVEAEFDVKAFLGDLQAPVLMLQDDGHFLRVLLAQAVGNSNAGGIGVKRDIEVMLAGEAGFLDPFQREPHDAAKSVLGQQVVPHLIFGHGVSRLLPASPNTTPVEDRSAKRISPKSPAKWQ